MADLPEMDFQDKYHKQLSWLLEGDPSIRYQTLRYLVGAPEQILLKERKRILIKGWGRSFMDLQKEDGTWSNALYSPKWTSTFYTLLVLKRLGAPLNQDIEKACRVLLDRGFYQKDGGINYWKTWKQGECCVTGMLLSMLCHFQIQDLRIHRMVEFLLSDQMQDHGWNCERYKGATHSSFHTTISVLEGLWEYEKVFSGSEYLAAVQEAQDAGIEFLLLHHLYKSNTTWQPVDLRMTKLSFPPRWHSDILRCLDYFQDRMILKDSRLDSAIDLLKAKQTPEGFWKLEIKYPAKVFFEMEKVGQESRWNTLRALRVLQWWQLSVQ